MDRTTERQPMGSPEKPGMAFDRPQGAPKIEPTHALMDAEAAAIVFGGHLFDGDNLFNVCQSIVRNDQRRLAEQDGAKNAERTPGERPRRGRLLVEFPNASTPVGDIAAMSEAMRRDGIENVPAWQLDERGVPYSIAIYARDEQ